MNFRPITYSFIVLFLLFVIGCVPKAIEAFKPKTTLRYSNTWEKLTNYPTRTGRNDDLHFFNPQEGFAINSQGILYLTEDGGESWELKFESEEDSFFRCLTFKNRQEGWLGTLGPGDAALSSDDPVIMYETKDGGENWSPVTFNGPYPGGLCGLQTVSDKVIVGCGRVRGPSFFIKSTDGGETWNSYDYSHLAGSLIAPYFYDEQHGLLIGGTTDEKIECRSLILETFDGGTSWDTIFVSPQKGEYCWKVNFPSAQRGFISIQRNAKGGYTYVLETFDGGKSWQEKKIQKGKYYVQGVGFANEQVGWLGGHPRGTKETRDGGKTWHDMADVGRGYNKFQFFGDSIGYGVGYGVYKMEGIGKIPEGPVPSYFENGKLQSMINYKNGQKNGAAEFFYENGDPMYAGKMKNNIRIGKWKYYPSSGISAQTLNYKLGVAQLSTEIMQLFVGTYQINEKATRTISFADGKLYSKHSRSNNTLEMVALSATEFTYVNNVRNVLEFVQNEYGVVTHQVMRANGEARSAELLRD